MIKISNTKLSQAKPSQIIVTVLVALISIPLVILILVAMISSPFSGCTKAQSLANKAAPQLASRLDVLNLIPGNHGKTTTYVTGDCIDTSSHHATADVVYLVDATSVASLKQMVDKRLTELGYSSRAAISVDPDLREDSKYFAYEDYVNSKGEVVSISYVCPASLNKPKTPGIIGSTDPAEIRSTAVHAMISEEFKH